MVYVSNGVKDEIKECVEFRRVLFLSQAEDGIRDKGM